MTPITHRHPVGRPQIFLALQDRIERGDYAPGSWLPAERVLAEEFDVDRSAVRDAFRRLEKQGLIVRERGRRPWVNHELKATRDREPETARRTIVAILPHHPIYPASLAIVHGLNAVLRSKEDPFRLLVLDTYGETTDDQTAHERRALQTVEEENIAGVVIWHQGAAETLPLLRRIQERRIPLVFVDRYPLEMTCDFVGVDNQTSAREAVHYLLTLGHRRIAHLTSAEQTTTVLQRQEGYREALQAAGIEPRPEWIYAMVRESSPDVRFALEQFLAAEQPPTAVLAVNDPLAHYCITEAEARGLRVPDDLSVIGFDDLERYSPRPPLLTTMHQPFDRIGRHAVELLQRQMHVGESTARVGRYILLPAPMVVRSTCKDLGKEA